MITVSSDDPKIKQVFRLMESDLEMQTNLRMSDVMAGERLKYNDRGPVHVITSSKDSPKIFYFLTQKTTSTTVRKNIYSLEDSRVVVLCGLYMHDLEKQYSSN